MSPILAKLHELGITLPAPLPSVANYLGCKKSGHLLYVSGRVSALKGAVGADVEEDAAKQAARDTVLLLLAIVRESIGDLDAIFGVVKLQGFINSAPHFTRQPFVLDGASELLIELFGEEGRHARTATGVTALPFGATLQLDMILELKGT